MSVIESDPNKPENPLDVLSRAATMVEKEVLVADKKCERSSSFKERHPKFRKSSTPDYLVALSLKRQNSLTQSDPSEPMEGANPPNNNLPAEDLPLDMSIKKKPEAPPPPPPYRSPPQYKYKSPPPYPNSTPSPPAGLNIPTGLPPPPSYEDSTVKCSYPTKNSPPPPILRPTEPEEKTKIKEITIITNSSADPLLDEHFRRSLGDNYENLFKKNSESPGSSSAGSTPPKVPQVVSESDIKSNQGDSTKVEDPVKAFQEDMEMEGYTVEDHFAKALGDTWVQLQKKEEEKRKSKSEEKAIMAT